MISTLIFQHRRFFVCTLLTGILLRSAFIAYFPTIEDYDTAYYAEIGRTWLHYGIYGHHYQGIVTPTYSRLPGYPIFLAAVFRFFGDNHYLPVLLIQLLADLGSCFLIMAITFELFGEGAALGAFLVSMVCPFTANYVAVALTETLSIFFTSLSLWAAVKGIRVSNNAKARGIKWWFLCGVAISLAIFLRPDGILLLMTLWIMLSWTMLRGHPTLHLLLASAVTTMVVVVMLAPWTWRNWVVFHEFQPLAPRYATNGPWEYAPTGFDRWFKTWPVEFALLYDIYWKVSSQPTEKGEVIDLHAIPPWVFDTRSERQQTLQLFKQLNKTLLLTPKLDAQFDELARQRIARHPIRYYLYLPILRIADMWFRPRTEQLEIEQHWWRFKPRGESLFSIGYALLNVLLVIIAIVGMVRFRHVPGVGLLIGYVIIRSAFLGTLANPEPRYVLECFPVILTFAGAQCYAIWQKGFFTRTQ